MPYISVNNCKLKIMNLGALERIREVIIEWEKRKFYTYQTKKCYPYESPVSQDEFILRFTTSLKNFNCNNTNIPIDLISKPFLTTTISNNTFSDNQNADKIRLVEFLVNFDNQFNELVEEKINECQDNLIASEQFFFD